MFVPNFKILSQVVSKKSLTEKKFTDKQTSVQKRQKLYTPIYFIYRGYRNMIHFMYVKKLKFLVPLSIEVCGLIIIKCV